MAEKKSPYRKALLLLVILLFPSLFYLFLSSGRHNSKQLPVYGPKDITETGDTVYHTIPEFSFTNQYGNEIGLEVTEGKYAVVDYFFTTCQTICPMMSDQLARVQKKLEDMEDLVILSHTVNPETDTVKVMRDYAEKMGAKKGKWHFLTGSKKALYDQARHGYYITAMKGDGGPEDFIHSEKLILVDKQNRIRGYYDGTDPEDVDRLIDEIKVLKAQEQIPKKE